MPGARATYHRGYGYHHVRHRADGGPDVAENVVLLCRLCHDLHHKGKAGHVAIPTAAGDPPASFDCRNCGNLLDPRKCRMNCGWYECHACGERTHLFDHFAYAEFTAAPI